MDLFHSFILGIVEGISEFLPISSTAHLIIVSQLFGVPQADFQKFFEVFIQAGAILAVVVIYFRYVLKHPKIVKKILYSFVPTAVIGLIFYKIIKTIFFESNSLIIDAIFFVGLIFVILEYFIQKKKIKLTRSMLYLSNLDAIKIGFAQALAVVPGVSRSGIVMVAMMFMGFRREDAALYSFLIAVPTILAASAYDLFKMRAIVFSSLQNFPLLLVGFVMSFVTAYIVVNWFIGFLKKNSLIYFGIYRIALAIILMFVL